jgi:hypothetical protein
LPDGIQIERSKHAQEFVIVGNREARDNRLTLRARGLHHYLLSLPSGWRTTTARMAEDMIEGRDAIRTALNELITFHYVTRDKHRDAAGRWSTTVTVHDMPQTGPENPSWFPPAETQETAGRTAPENPASVHPASVDQALSIKTDPKTLKENGGEEISVAPPATPVVAGATNGLPTGSRLRRERATLTNQDKIDGTRFAIAAVYGEDWNPTISDEEVLTLFTSMAPKSGKVTSVTAYMTKIFGNTPRFETLRQRLDNETDDGGDDYDQAREMREKIINGQPVTWECARCHHGYNGLGQMADSGVCVWCQEELRTRREAPRHVTPGTVICPRCEAASATGSGICVWCQAEQQPPDPAAGWNVSILKAVQTALFVVTGKAVDDEWAAKVAEHILTGRNFKQAGAGPKVKYITTTISNDGNPGRFLPTQTPARVA